MARGILVIFNSVPFGDFFWSFLSYPLGPSRIFLGYKSKRKEKKIFYTECEKTGTAKSV